MVKAKGDSREDHQAQGVTALQGVETDQISPEALYGLAQPGGSLRWRDEEKEYRGRLSDGSGRLQKCLIRKSALQ